MEDLIYSYGERFLQELLVLGEEQVTERSLAKVPRELLEEISNVPRSLGNESATLRIVDHFFRHKSEYQND